jgi:hypothetical protein
VRQPRTNPFSPSVRYPRATARYFRARVLMSSRAHHSPLLRVGRLAASDWRLAPRCGADGGEVPRGGRCVAAPDGFRRVRQQPNSTPRALAARLQKHARHPGMGSDMVTTPPAVDGEKPTERRRRRFSRE